MIETSIVRFDQMTKRILFFIVYLDLQSYLFEDK